VLFRTDAKWFGLRNQASFPVPGPGDPVVL
jgi:hypothetical protein